MNHTDLELVKPDCGCNSTQVACILVRRSAARWERITPVTYETVGGGERTTTRFSAQRSLQPREKFSLLRKVFISTNCRGDRKFYFSITRLRRNIIASQKVQYEEEIYRVGKCVVVSPIPNGAKEFSATESFYRQRRSHRRVGRWKSSADGLCATMKRKFEERLMRKK